jgi:hypothetical protein
LILEWLILDVGFVVCSLVEWWLLLGFGCWVCNLVEWWSLGKVVVVAGFFLWLILD